MTEANINEIRMLLHNHPQWNRSRVSRELCEQWHWRRPDGQIKDMACRELLRKLESHALINLPPRQRPGVREHYFDILTINAVEGKRKKILAGITDTTHPHSQEYLFHG